MSRAFDRYMVQVGVGTNRKLRRLPVAQRWAYVAGVLSLAAQSPIRGALLIADGEPVTEQDVAEEATIPLRDARAAMASLRKLGMLDCDAAGVEWVHDWDSLNPDPKPSDSPEATRERKRAERERKRAERNGHGVTPESRVTPPQSHAPEVEGEEKSDSANAESPSDVRPEVERLCSLLADMVEQNGSKRPTVGKAWFDACRRMIDIDGRTEEGIEKAIRWCQADEFWRGNVLSMPKLREKYDQLRLAAQRSTGSTSTADPERSARRARRGEALERLLAQGAGR